MLQVAQHADDLDRAVRCYEELLGTSVTARFDPPGLAFFVLDNIRLLLDVGAPSALLYLEVDSVRAEIERLRDAGFTVSSEPHVIFTHETTDLGPAGHDEWMAAITDTEGNTVLIASHEPRDS